MLRRAVKLACLALAAVIILLVGAAAWFKLVLVPTPDYSDLDDFHPFKSAAAQRAAFEYYARRAQMWPVPFVTRTVQTAHGETFVTISGGEELSPLVLLPGGGQSSLMWIPNVDALAGQHRVHAVDNIVDIGRSRQKRPMRSGQELSECLCSGQPGPDAFEPQWTIVHFDHRLCGNDPHARFAPANEAAHREPVGLHSNTKLAGLDIPCHNGVGVRYWRKADFG